MVAFFSISFLFFSPTIIIVTIIIIITIAIITIIIIIGIAGAVIGIQV